jgi:hypothetical protein
MVFSQDHPDEKLQGVAKGMKEVLRERESAWDELTKRCGKVVGKCKACTTSQIKKDAERRVAEAEAMGQESSLTDAEVVEASSSVPSAPQDEWCCAYRVLSLQDDFVNEKPLLQHYLEGRGHVCLFLPKFHCELNPIEMLWGYAKYRESYLTGYQLIIHNSKVIGQLLTENLPRRKSLFPNVSICVTQ